MRQPLMVIFEDLHWIDTETRVLLNRSPTRSPPQKSYCWSTIEPEYPISS